MIKIIRIIGVIGLLMLAVPEYRASAGDILSLWFVCELVRWVFFRGNKKAGYNPGVLQTDFDVRVAFDYVDANGARTKREVSVNSVDVMEDGTITYIHGYSKMRKAQRTFRIDRISNLVDLTTGEVFENPAHFFQDLLKKAAGK